METRLLTRQEWRKNFKLEYTIWTHIRAGSSLRALEAVNNPVGLPMVDSWFIGRGRMTGTIFSSRKWGMGRQDSWPSPVKDIVPHGPHISVTKLLRKRKKIKLWVVVETQFLYHVYIPIVLGFVFKNKTFGISTVTSKLQKFHNFCCNFNIIIGWYFYGNKF